MWLVFPSISEDLLSYMFHFNHFIMSCLPLYSGTFTVSLLLLVSSFLMICDEKFRELYYSLISLFQDPRQSFSWCSKYWAPTKLGCWCCTVTQSCLTLWPHGLLHTRLPCPSPSPEVCSNSWPLSLWSHPTISSSVVSFSCSQCFPALRSFLVSQLFTSSGQILELQHQSF